MTARQVDRLLLTGVILSVFVAAWRWHVSASPALGSPEYVKSTSTSSTGVVQSESGTDVASIVKRNPFRLSGRPALIRHGTSGTPEARVTAKYRPSLVLKAIVGGPPWAALIGGVPGRGSDALVHVGQRLDSLLVRSIAADGVTIVGPDTTWILTLSRGIP